MSRPESRSRQFVRIAAEANVSDRTVRRYYDEGQKRRVHPLVEEAIKQAAKKLGIKIARRSP